MKDNKQLLKEVQESLANNSSLRDCLHTIYVLVNDGVVILAGSVDNLSLKNIARNIVHTLPGVNLLIEDLKIEVPKANRVGVQIDWVNGNMALSHS
jgi:osmotically-inducible protein OsmY